MRRPSGADDGSFQEQKARWSGRNPMVEKHSRDIVAQNRVRDRSLVPPKALVQPVRVRELRRGDDYQRGKEGPGSQALRARRLIQQQRKLAAFRLDPLL